MINAVHVERLRGIRTGRLSELTPLTVLVGPSGAGKSTILDALLIAAGGAPGDAMGRVVRRRAELPQGGPWLFERCQPDAQITLEGDEPSARTCKLSWSPNPSEDLVGKLPRREQSRRPVELDCHVTSAFGRFRARTVISAGNEYRFDLTSDDAASDVRRFQEASDVRLVEPAAGANHPPLHRAFSAAAEQGRLDAVIEIVRGALDGVVDLRVLTVQDEPVDQAILHLDYATHTVPVAGAGSGIYALVRLALDLAAMPSGLALVEEPEIHQHPAGTHRTANVLHSAARRGVQVVVSTHSLDLVDSLVATATEEDLERLCVMRVLLDRGTMQSSRFSGPMVRRARQAMDEDLR